MSPEGPRFPSSETAKDDKDKKRRKRAGFVAPLPITTGEKPADKPKRSILDEAIDRLDAKKKEEKPAGSQEETPADEPALKRPAAAEMTDEATAHRGETAGGGYEALPDSELEPGELSGGEVIVRLQGDEPVAERVIPLHAEEKSPESVVSKTPAEPAEEAPLRPSQNAEDSAPAPEAPAAGGGETPPPPPPEAPPAAAEPPEPERPEPAMQPPAEVLYRPQAEAATTSAILPNAAPATGERPATKEEVEDALHRTAKVHAQHGALSGLFVGSWLANRSLRRRQKQESKELDRQGRQLRQVTEELHTVQGTQESRHTAAEQQFGSVRKRFENLPRTEKARPAPEQAKRSETAVNPKPTEQLEIPRDHHLETSAWHTIEIDSKTGKPVEKPVFDYGHEYYRERAHETTPALQLGAAAGEVALVAAAMGQASGQSAQPGSAAHIQLATTQGVPKAARAAGPKPAKKASAALQSTAPLWPWLLALLVVIICLVAVIR